ncbi:MAG: hypothetical protein Q8S71_03895 [Hydrogenophaga sp.]|nr:hypothetical protein [Hydrogenophaga sp.]
MRFNPDDHNSIEKNINDVNFRTSVWIKDHRTLAPDDRVNVVLNVKTGSASTGLVIEEHDIHGLIEFLQMTLDHIKSAEIELLALQTKAAA